MADDLKLVEYQSLQKEVALRCKILHDILNLGAIILFISILGFFILKILSLNENLLQMYLLSLPIIFSFLAFNYQANGMTLEVALKYTQELFNKSWRAYYIERRKQQKLIGLMKMCPLIVPQLIPFIMLLFGRINFSYPLIQLLFYSDIFFLIFLVVNFRYKLIYGV